MSGFTPWKPTLNGAGLIAVRDSRGDWITYHAGERGTTKEAEANARLIAAAPELLEALQMLAEAADTSDDCQYGTLSTGFVRDISRAAIAKATGAQP